MPRRKNQGKRTRFNGFQLGDSDRDRIVADWINAQPNAAESIKALIYKEAIGLHWAFHQGVERPGKGQETDTRLDVDDPRVKALASLDT